MTISAQTDGRSPDSGHPFPRTDWRSPFRHFMLGLAALIIVLVAMPGLLHLGGLQMVTVNGYSMGPAVPDQSIVIVRSVSGESLRTGDVIIFVANWLDGAARATNVVHRLSLITPTPAGLVGYTSGDANLIADPNPLSLQGELPIVKLVVPYAAIFYGMSSIILLMSLIVLVFVQLAVSWWAHKRSIRPEQDARSLGPGVADKRTFADTVSDAVMQS